MSGLVLKEVALLNQNENIWVTVNLSQHCRITAKSTLHNPESQRSAGEEVLLLEHEHTTYLLLSPPSASN